MKKLASVFIFILMTGLFSGVFFSTNLSYENNEYLSSLLISGFESGSPGFISSLLSALSSNFILAALMLPALVAKPLCPLPPAMLWFKSFAIGFCSGLLYLNSEKAITMSLLKIFPQNIFLLPAFLIMSITLFCISISGGIKKSRPVQEKKGLLLISAASCILLLTGCVIEAICHSAAL
ncbi:stage II sporulation protein M [Gallibacter sp. Marseille-QA0791]|uniref:stage II sporulation protein M n=1 Tax=Gallibacter sp. Marseille-QA0791 TaxID=3378781 RepID=UPI003D0D46E2